MDGSVKNTQTTGGLTADQIERMKTQHGPLTLISTTDAQGAPLHFWFKNPDVKALSAFTKIARNDEVIGLQVLLKNCLINKEVEMQADDATILLSIGEQMTKALVKKRPATTTSF